MGGTSSVIVHALKEQSTRKYCCASPTKISDYQLGALIGKGSFATVRVAKYPPTGTVMALKETKLEEHNAEKIVDFFAAELSVLRRLGNHPNLPALHVAFCDGTSCFLGQDYAPGGDLRYHLNRGNAFSMEQVAFILYLVGSALNFMHNHNIMHRDVKPENIVLKANGSPILTDFGISDAAGDNSIPLSKSSSGTQQYLAPEVLTPSHRHSVHADFWSLGIVGYELLFKQRPFESYCWKSMIYFAENHYRILWDRVEVENELGVGECMPGEIDWCVLADCTESERVDMMRYSRHDIQLLDDGSVPEELRVSIPPVTASGEATSSECIDLLNGLMDVRIPKRLGVGIEYEAFREHDFFTSHCIAANIATEKPAPLIPDIEKIEAFLKAKYAELTFFHHAKVVMRDEVYLSKSLKEKMKSAEFVSAEMGGEVEGGDTTCLSNFAVCRVFPGGHSE